MRRVEFILDSDAVDPEKAPHFDACTSRIGQALMEHNLDLVRINMPSSGREKVGLDDYLMKHGTNAFLLLRKIISLHI
ncbi:MAG: hypothetical protein A2X49_01490 [Lentisphaerae bacterium GWF2_52_8]|nr:MAG: hypothetical protein A2X49_01490 [Lentisphaerae bacterium GWF2_52_8]